MGAIPAGCRHIGVILPAELVVELDVALAALPEWRSRSSVVREAIRRYLDDGLLGGTPARQEENVAPRDPSRGWT